MFDLNFSKEKVHVVLIFASLNTLKVMAWYHGCLYYNLQECNDTDFQTQYVLVWSSNIGDNFCSW